MNNNQPKVEEQQDEDKEPEVKDLQEVKDLPAVKAEVLEDPPKCQNEVKQIEVKVNEVKPIEVNSVEVKAEQIQENSLESEAKARLHSRKFRK